MLTESEKIMVAGCAAGVTAAAIPTAYGFIKAAAAAKPIADSDFLHTENSDFVNENGIRTSLRGVNLNDDLFYFSKADIAPDANGYDVFYALEKRFGAYGARQLVKKYNEGFIAPSDIKFISKLGANCVRIPLRYKYLCSKDNCKDIDFERIDFLVEKCRKAGLYVIFELHSAPGFQNTDSACGSEDKSVLFESSKDGFEARNAVIRFWTQLAVHYKDEATVAAYDLLNRPLNRMAEWTDKLDMLRKFYKRIYTAIRHVDEKHIIIMESAGSHDSLPEENELSNVAYGFYSRFHTTYETDALVNSVRRYKNNGIPCIVCKIRAEENLDYSLTKLNDCGASWLIGDYKGTGLKSAYIFGGNVPAADLVFDSYDEIGQKWSKPLATKNFTENKDMTSLLKTAFKYGKGSVEAPEGTKKRKPEFRVKFGFNVIKGV